MLQPKLDIVKHRMSNEFLISMSAQFHYKYSGVDRKRLNHKGVLALVRQRDEGDGGSNSIGVFLLDYFAVYTVTTKDLPILPERQPNSIKNKLGQHFSRL